MPAFHGSAPGSLCADCPPLMGVPKAGGVPDKADQLLFIPKNELYPSLSFMNRRFDSNGLHPCFEEIKVGKSFIRIDFVNWLIFHLLILVVFLQQFQKLFFGIKFFRFK